MKRVLKYVTKRITFTISCLKQTTDIRVTNINILFVKFLLQPLIKIRIPYKETHYPEDDCTN